MKYYKEYTFHHPEICGKRKKYDTTIYVFDIETTSIIKTKEKVLSAYYYETLTEEEKETIEYYSCMYIWQFSVNDVVYYGRTWEELKEFWSYLDSLIPYEKTVFIHNLSFEFQFLKTVFSFDEVFARKKRKVMRASIKDMLFTFHCTYFMTQLSLEKIPEHYSLSIEKKVGDLDYTLLRHFNTPLTSKELLYCEYDCLVVYEYIKKEMTKEENITKLPLTSTGYVRRELKTKIRHDSAYKRKVYQAINTNTHIFNLLNECFAGGYTHANMIYTGEIIKDVDSYDFTSSYPYIMLTHRFPSTEFKACSIKKKEQMLKQYAYIIVVRYKNLESKTYNTFISQSKARKIVGGEYDNGRIIRAKEVEIVLTDVDFNLYFECYSFEYEILECYYSLYRYLPKTFLDFILEKYVKKTEYKNVEGKELEYNLEKRNFNALYGMSVTNMIRDNVVYNDNLEESGGWEEVPLTNEEIIVSLQKEKSKSFLSYAYGVWITAYGRRNLILNVIKLDDYVIYCDTDSMKLAKGYDKQVITEYNQKQEQKIDFVCDFLKLEKKDFMPKDNAGIPHMLGVFEHEGKEDITYRKFITQGAKKYAYEDEKGLHITVAGVPKSGAKCLQKLEEFQDGLVFSYEITNKLTNVYCENMESITFTDYLGNTDTTKDKSGCCLLPTSYTLGKSLEYIELLNEMSSERAKFKE